MLRFLGDGDGKYRLVNAGDEEVGWIRGRAVGFRGFASEEQAVAAATVGAEVLGAFLEQETGRRHLPEPSDPLRLVHDGAHEWVSDGRIPVARLSRPPTSAPGTSFAIEFVLPMAATEATAIHAAARVHAAIKRAAVTRADPGRDEREVQCA